MKELTNCSYFRCQFQIKFSIMLNLSHIPYIPNSVSVFDVLTGSTDDTLSIASL